MTAVTEPRGRAGPAAGGTGRALARARDHLLGLQNPAGWWKAELETNVTMDAEDLMLRHFLGILDRSEAAEAGRWIRSNQHDDGTWGTFYGSPPDLSTTIEAYVALRLAGAQPDEPLMQKAAAWVRNNGGIAASRVFTRIWLAVVGQWDWEDLPVVPPEIMFLPKRVPLNIYDFACWARQTVVALTVVMSYRPARPLPFGLDELTAPDPHPVAPPSITTRAGQFQALDRALHAYERLPEWVRPRQSLRRAALAKAERWILDRQEADGLWGGIQPPVVYSVIALHLLGYPLDHQAMRSALAGIDSFTIHDEKGRRIEACQSPVWDTALAVVALADAGVEPTDPAMRAAAGWLLQEEITVTGDWAVRRPDLRPG
ncbi:MAG TPA: prenyltransferase/squalene oxidase repeat-containing protein, partial [Acidimicrobiales bacterium]|nr:prenyltransferase/squalene oxidase repeat-containing protein [Acidimicrobiales bacterium]